MSRGRHQPDSLPEPRRRRPGWTPALVLAALFALAAVPLIATGFDRGRGAFDDINYHAKVIATFAAQWPRGGPDFADYLSMTTPGYHLVLAGVSVYISDARAVLQGAGMLFTLALLMLLARATARRAGDNTPTLPTLAVCLPVACSLYVVNAGVWLLPDNAAWLGVLGVLLIALRPRVDKWTCIGGGLTLLALVFTRQVHLWAAAPLWVAAWLGSAQGHRPPRILGEPTPGASLARTAACVLCTIPAFAIVAYFARLWGGLCPPSFVNWVKPPNRPTPYSPAAPAFILALIGVASCFYAAHLAPGFVRLWRHARWVLVVAAVAGLALALIPPTSSSREDGRSSGLWAIAHILPIAKRSPAIAGLSCLGAVLLAAWCASVSLRDRLILIAALAGFAATQTVNPWVWQRYIEPLILILMALFAASAAAEAAPHRDDIPSHRSPRLRALGVAGPFALAALLAANTARELVREPASVPDLGFIPGPPGNPHSVWDPPIHAGSGREPLKPGSSNPDN